MIASFKKPLGLLLTISIITLSALADTNVKSDTNRLCRKKVLCADTVKAERICADELIVKTGCCACHTITAKDFMDADGNLSQTFVIVEPGKYCLGESIEFAPVVAGAVAIQILSDDVNLDLCNNTLDQVNSTANAVSIRLGNAAGTVVHSNITVINGNITHFTGQAIGANNTIVNSGAAFADLRFTHLNILECGINTNPSLASGINLSSNGNQQLFLNPPIAYKNVNIENVNANRCLGLGAIRIATGDNVVIQNCQANDLRSNANVTTLAYRLACRNLQMSDCQGNGTQSTSPTNFFFQVGGAVMSGDINLLIKDCQFNDTFGEANFLVNGINCSNAQNAIFENCQFNNPRGGNAAFISNGIHLSDSPFQQTQANGLKFLNCQFNGARVNADNPDALIIAGVVALTTRNMVFENCQASNISADGFGCNAYGFFIAMDSTDPAPEFSNVRNTTFTNCIASDISSERTSAVGFFFGYFDASRTGEQAQQSNMVIENCIAERIRSNTSTVRCAGIIAGLIPFFGQQFAVGGNLLVKGCRVSDVRSNQEEVSPLSGGIVVNATSRPVLIDNSVSDCDRGILFTGSDLITPSTLFQLAETLDDALAFPPVFIDLAGVNTYAIGTTSQSGQTVLGVGTTFTSAMVGGTITYQSGAKATIRAFLNATTLLTAQALNEPNQPYSITFGLPPSAPVQLFTNVSIPGQDPIEIAPSASTIDLGRDYLFSPTNLNTLGWQVGDQILYDANGGLSISDLVSSTTYFLIVYVPGFAESGVVMNNEVDNCSVSGYQDDRTIVIDDVVTPRTSSAWVNNFAFNNGVPATREATYDIGWASVVFPMPPVMHGDLALYPTGSEKTYNISLIPN